MSTNDRLPGFLTVSGCPLIGASLGEARRDTSGMAAHHLIRDAEILGRLLGRHSFDFLKGFRTIL